MSKKTDFSFCLAAMAMILLSAVLSIAQVTGGAVTGVVRDVNDAVIPTATVTLRNQATGQSYAEHRQCRISDWRRRQTLNRDDGNRHAVSNGRRLASRHSRVCDAESERAIYSSRTRRAPDSGTQHGSHQRFQPHGHGVFA